MLDPGVLSVGALLGVLEGPVGGDLGGDLLCDHLSDAVHILPLDAPELVVEGLEDVAELVHLRLGLVAPLRDGDGFDMTILVLKGDGFRGTFLHAVAVHVDGFEDALGEILVDGGGELGDQEV